MLRLTWSTFVVSMFRSSLISPLFLGSQVSGTLSSITSVNQTAPYLNLTAINAVDGRSVLECWQMGPFKTSSEPGVAGSLALFLGDTFNTTYNVIPPRYDGGLHTAPAFQLALFASGVAHVTFPDSDDEVWIQGGRYGLIIAADTADVSAKGHFTTYPGDSNTIALAVPLRDRTTFKYKLLHNGSCDWEELVGI